MGERADQVLGGELAHVNNHARSTRGRRRGGQSPTVAAVENVKGSIGTGRGDALTKTLEVHVHGSTERETRGAAHRPVERGIMGRFLFGCGETNG